MVADTTSVVGAQDNTLEELIAATPLKASHAKALRRGRTVSTGLKQVSRREVAVAVACLRRSDTSALEQIRELRQPLFDGELMIAHGIIDPADPGAGLAQLDLGAAATVEAKRYLEFVPGEGLNLSLEEIGQFQTLGKKADIAVPGDVEALLRRQLEARVYAYLDGGLLAMAPYARGKDSFAGTAEELRTTPAAESLRQLFPELHGAWSNYPDAVPEEAQEHLYWAQLEVKERPITVLAHRIDATLPGGREIIGELYYYSSQFFNSGYMPTAVVPVAEGTVFFYVSRFWIDYWSGMERLKQKAGQRLMRGEMQ